MFVCFRKTTIMMIAITIMEMAFICIKSLASIIKTGDQY